MATRILITQLTVYEGLREKKTINFVVQLLYVKKDSIRVSKERISSPFQEIEGQTPYSPPPFFIKFDLFN